MTHMDEKINNYMGKVFNILAISGQKEIPGVIIAPLAIKTEEGQVIAGVAVESRVFKFLIKCYHEHVSEEDASQSVLAGIVIEKQNLN